MRRPLLLAGLILWMWLAVVPGEPVEPVSGARDAGTPVAQATSLPLGEALRPLLRGIQTGLAIAVLVALARRSRPATPSRRRGPARGPASSVSW